MATLPTNFKDDILDTSVNTRRRYRVYENTDGTIELEDVTEYSQVGDVFGSGQINATNTEVNKKFDKNMLVRDLDTINAITEEGYAPDALALKDVNNSLHVKTYGNLSEVEIKANSIGTANVVIPDYSEWIAKGYIGIVITAYFFISNCTSNARSRTVNTDNGIVVITYDNGGTTTSVKPIITVMWLKSNKVILG